MTSEETLANVRALVPEIQRRAEEAAKLRRIPSDLAEKLRAAGVFRIMFPRQWGGPEMPLPQQVELIETLAYADPSVAERAGAGCDPVGAGDATGGSQRLPKRAHHHALLEG